MARSPRLWYMNADFETELSYPPGHYHRSQASEALNHRLSPHLLWLAEPGDALLVSKPWSEYLQHESQKCRVNLVDPEFPSNLCDYHFTPWGWTRTAIEEAHRVGAIVNQPVSLATIGQVNSKLWSHALEVEKGWALPGTNIASSFEELSESVAHGCPGAEDKWVIKSPYGFAARERVLGRGPRLEGPPAVWSQRRLQKGETLIFQPWLEVIREYGVVMEIAPAGSFEIHGVSDLQTNGAGTGKGYQLGRPPSPVRLSALEETATVVANHLFQAGYFGPVGFDALEHTHGLHPLLEINARYTMGFIALAVEKMVKPQSPVFWDLNLMSLPARNFDC